MTDDREPFRTARDAGLKARHETRLARTQAEIPYEALDAGALAVSIPRSTVRTVLEAALPHLRSHETREARAIRREVAKEIADAIEDRRSTPIFGPVARGALKIAAEIAREIGSKEDPK